MSAACLSTHSDLSLKILPPTFSEEEFRDFLWHVSDTGSSDIRFQSNDYVTVYFRRDWYPITNRPLDNDEVKKVLRFLMGPEAVATLGSKIEVKGEVEIMKSVSDREKRRLRLIAVAGRMGGVADGVAIVLRTIPEDVPELSEMGLPDGLASELMVDKGLVLINGPTGSGKTTLMAALLGAYCERPKVPAILMFEDPTEIAFHKKGIGRGPIVVQVSVGHHLRSWDQATPIAMRMKPDIIVMGEVRNAETAEHTADMALTGHAVYATLHCDTPGETMYRLVEMFPYEVRSAGAAKLLGALRAICSRQLVKLNSGKVVPLTSWLLFDKQVRDDLSSEAWPYSRWKRYVDEQTVRLKQDFASQCIPHIRTGEMSLERLRAVTRMSQDEAKAFVVAAGAE